MPTKTEHKFTNHLTSVSEPAIFPVMKRLLLIPAVGLSLAACGTTHKVDAQQVQSNAQVQQATKTFDQSVRNCLPQKDGAPNLFVLRSHAGRKAFEDCAIPRSKRTAFNRCLTHVALSGIPTVAKLKAGGESCATKVGL